MPKKRKFGERGETPAWLAPTWEAKKADTLERVKKAINEINREGRSVSLRNITKKAEEMDGRPLSATTIQRNEASYREYLKHRKLLPSRQRRGWSIAEFLEQTPADERRNVQTRISYLRKEKKDDLIAKILSLQMLVEFRDEEALHLREELLRLTEQLTN
jgi:hypothetical protein